MDKCDYYIKSYGRCLGTKEVESCTCQGDKSKCDFYPEKRNKRMATLDMMNLARTNNKTYRAKDCLYNTKLGFHYKVGCEWDATSFTYLNELFDIDNWEEDDAIYMTKFEAEEKYGIRIVG